MRGTDYRVKGPWACKMFEARCQGKPPLIDGKPRCMVFLCSNSDFTEDKSIAEIPGMHLVADENNYTTILVASTVTRTASASRRKSRGSRQPASPFRGSMWVSAMQITTQFAVLCLWYHPYVCDFRFKIDGPCGRRF